LFTAGGRAYNLSSTSTDFDQGLPQFCFIFSEVSSLIFVAPANEDDSHDIDMIKTLSGTTTEEPSPPTSRPTVVPPPPPQPVAPPKAAAAIGGTGAPKCTACAKSVYKMEELLAVGRTWHAACFVCGGTGTDF
jgi:hypothetical protein